VESCTALAEDHNGMLSVIRWVELDHLHQRPNVTPMLAARAERTAA